jgi:hypothetical protein
MRYHQKRRQLGAKRSRVWDPARLCNDAGAVSGGNPFGKGAARAHGVVALLAKASSLRVVARLALRPDSPFRTRLRSVNRP